MVMEMSVSSMKSNWETGSMAGQPHMLTIRKTILENISPQFNFYTMKMSLFYPFCLLITVLQLTFCQFLVKNCGQIFSNVVFLLVNIVCYPSTIPVYQLDFMVLNDISNALCFAPEICNESQNQSKTAQLRPKNCQKKRA